MSAAIYIHGGEMAPVALLMALFVMVGVPLICWFFILVFVQGWREGKTRKKN